MDCHELEFFWNNINKPERNEYSFMRINADCIPELSLGFNRDRNYCLFLFLFDGPLADFNEETFEHFKTSYNRQFNCIIIELLDVFYLNIFLDLIISLFYSIKDVEDERNSTRIFIEKINLWSTFFVRPRNKKLKEDTVKGIIGELIYLRKILNNGGLNTVNNLLNSWKGPYSNNHDFELENKDVEVKAKSANKNFVKISSEFQLEIQNYKNLELAIISLDRSDEGSITLENLINELRLIIINLGGDVTILFNCLKQYGLSFLNLNLYNDLKYKLISILILDATSNNFPKIVSNNLPNGISKVRYRLYINGLIDYILEEIIVNDN